MARKADKAPHFIIPIRPHEVPARRGASRGGRRLSREEWAALSNDEKVSASLRGEEPERTPEEEREDLIGWYNQTLGALYWFRLARVKAAEAAQLLSCSNPHEAGASWLNATNEAMAPNDRIALLRGFEDVGGERPLTEWRRLAKERGWRYDPWVDEYITAAPDVLPGAPAAATKAVSRAAAHEAAILEKFRELGFNPMKLPKPARGKSSPPVAKVRASLGLTADVMQKAMRRLFDNGQAAYVHTVAG